MTKSISLPQKAFLLNFVVTNLELDGETLRFQYKEPFEAIKDMVESKNWRAVAHKLRLYRSAVISISKEVAFAKQFLDDLSLGSFNTAPALSI